MRAHRSSAVLALVTWPTLAAAQCSITAQPIGALPGCNGVVHTVVHWDPDGTGPLGVRMVFGGAFTAAGSVQADHVAVFDPLTNTWSSLGAGLPGNHVSTAIGLPNGDLVVGGEFAVPGATNIARWNGSAWLPIGGAADARVSSLAVLPNGDLVAGGDFTSIGGVAATRIARWDGTTWSPIGAGLPSSVKALAVLPNGDLVANSGVPGNRVRRWNGSTWVPLGSGVGQASEEVLALAVMPNGDLVAGGDFTVAGGAPASRLARWDGSSWSPVGTGTYGVVHSLAVLPGGVLAAGGVNLAGWPAGIALYDGVAWSVPGGGIDGTIHAVTASPNSGNLVVAGDFTMPYQYLQQNVAQWNGTAWFAPGDALPFAPTALTTSGNGDLVVGGWFLNTSTGAEGVLRKSGLAWHRLGLGIQGPVACLATLPSGALVAAGSFVHAGVPAHRIARWDGVAWAPLGAGLDASVAGLVVMPGGDLVAGGAFLNAGGAPARRVARWNGAIWAPLGNGLDADVNGLEVLADGQLVAACIDGSIWRWDGAAWSALPIVSYVPVKMAASPNGSLLVTGSSLALPQPGTPFPTNVAIWNGSAWSALPALPTVYAVAALTDGTLIAAASSTSQPAAIRRWNGNAWQVLGPSMQAMDQAPRALHVQPDGRLLGAGAFTAIANQPAGFVAEWSTTCPATAVSLGGGCLGSAGPTALTATTRPWLGGTYRARGTGMPATSLVLSIFGFTTTPPIPLTIAWSVGVPGCHQFVGVDLIDVLLPSSGAANAAVPLPAAPALAGLLFHHQMFPFEFDAGMNLIAVAATNALTLTAGTW